MSDTKIKTSVMPEWLAIFTFGGAVSLLLLYWAMTAYGDVTVGQSTIFGSAIYWIIATVVVWIGSQIKRVQS